MWRVGPKQQQKNTDGYFLSSVPEVEDREKIITPRYSNL